MKSKNLSLMLGLFIVLLSIVGCSDQSSNPEIIPEEDPIAEEIDQDLPENVSFWGFEEGFNGWEYPPGWTVENGFAQSSTQHHGIFSHDQWQDFHLFTGIEIQKESGLAIHFRETEQGGYQVLIQPGFISVLSVFEGIVNELLFQELSGESGRLELRVTVEGPSVQVELNGGILFEYHNLEYLGPGHLGLMNLGTGLVMVDYIEVHDLAVPSDESLEYVMPQMREIVIQEPPIAEKIIINAPEDSFNYLISGAPGAVAPGSFVSVANLETARVHFLTAEEDGSFETEIFAFPGTSIQIKHLNPDQDFHQMYQNLEGPGEVISGEHTAATGTIVRTPDLVEPQRGEIPLAIGGFFDPEKNFYWHFSGNLAVVDSDPQNFYIKLTGKMIITTEGNTPLPPTELVAGMGISLVRHFNQQGVQEVHSNFYVSDFFSPTGFPIYTGESPAGSFASFIPVSNWHQADNGTYQAEIDYDFLNSNGIPIQPGYYGLLLHGGLHEQMLGGEANTLPERVGPTMRSGVVYGPGGQFSPLFRLGEPDQPHLLWGLFTDVLHEATRGTVSREDLYRAGFITMISQQSEKFLLPMEDERTGEKIQYRLEPSLPYLSHGDRGLPGPPTIDLQISSSELSVTVRCPDGRVDEIGPSPFIQSVNATPAYKNGLVLDYSMGGGSYQDVYQLTTLNDAFSYAFDQYGHHVIEMTGWVEDITGNRYTGGGTYDVYVARPLKLYNGVLPSTPFIEGDVFSPSLQVYPRVPADIDIKLTILPNSSWDELIEHQISGRANEFGYFLPILENPIRFTGGGEYRADISAQYWNEEGILWMGSASWGSLIENQDTKLIAHGMRGLDTPDVNNLWFFNQNLEKEGTYHTLFPYFSGDIFWGHELEFAAPGLKSPGADAIIPGISMEDTSGEIYQILKESYENRIHAYYPVFEGGIENAIDVGEVVPFTTTSTGDDPALFPELIDQYGYAYQSSQRPGARVHESLAEGNNPLAYWRYASTYGKQVGIQGDSPNDIKWQFGGVVFRDESRNIHEYAAYSSFWVLIPGEDPIGGRVTPPFQGATGGPNGGPIMTIKGEEIDLLFLPRSGFPGQVLEVGNTLSFSGFVGPPLDSKLTIKVTSPSGETRTISGQANRIGYFYQPEDDFVVHEPGIWIVDIEVLHDGMTSSGPTMEPYPTGKVLGSEDGSYQIYVVHPDPPRTRLTSQEPGFVAISGEPITPIIFEGVLPGEFSSAEYVYTIRMPGVILEQGEGKADNELFRLVYDPVKLNRDFPNLDLTAMDDLRPGLADQVWITILFEKDGRYLPFTITLHGEEVFYR